MADSNYLPFYSSYLPFSGWILIPFAVGFLFLLRIDSNCLPFIILDSKYLPFLMDSGLDYYYLSLSRLDSNYLLLCDCIQFFVLFGVGFLYFVFECLPLYQAEFKYLIFLVLYSIFCRFLIFDFDYLAFRAGAGL